jgi:hypothetical protein
MSETVKFQVTVHIDAEDEVDTGLTVEQWNALSGAERGAWAANAWEALAQQDDGGFTMLTEGAESV